MRRLGILKKTIKNVNFLGLKDKINYKIYGKKLIERLINFYLKNQNLK